MQMGQVQLQMHFVTENILAERAGNHRLHGMLGDDVHLNPVGVFAAVVAVGTLIALSKKKHNQL